MDRVFESGASATPPDVPASPSSGYPIGGNPGAAIPATKPGPYWFYQVTEELMSVITHAGITADETVLTQLRDAIKRLSGHQVTTITASRALTIADAGVVLVDATAGNVTLTLPAASVLGALEYTFVRIDTTANTSVLQRAGADTIDGATIHPFDYFAPLNVLANGVSEWLRVGGVPAGVMGYWGNLTPPAGYLERNGAAVSRTTYKRLFAAIKTTYGVGDGVSTFNLPEGRAEFDRGLDNGRGIDSGRAQGSAQSDAYQGHGHRSSVQFAGMPASGTHAGSNYLSLQYVDAITPITDGVNGTPRVAAETRPRNIAHLAIIKY